MTEASDSGWIRIKGIVADAIELAAESRPAWIERACGGDPVLRGEVEALLGAHDRAGAFLEAPAIASLGAARRVVETADSSAGDHSRPDRLGAYRVLRELGRGGMGVVYLGARDDDRFDKQVAIKVVSGGVVHPAVFRRFEDERRILASLDHPNIARLLDAGTTEGGLPYVVMEHVEGESIDAYCSARRLAVRERLGLFLRVCAAVQYSHQHLVVHRDIKARNILVTADGVPKLLDFGIAKLLEPGGTDGSRTRTAFRVLTPESASPEQVRGEPVTVATDVYSLGVLLYRLLTGRSPYRGSMTTDPEIVLAAVYERIGYQLVVEGATARAIGTQQRALEIRRALAKQEPGNVSFRRKLAVSHFNIGYALEKAGNAPAASSHYGDMLAIYQDLAAADPTDAQARGALAHAYNCVGRVQVKKGDRLGSEQSYRAALAIGEASLAADPTNEQIRWGVASSRAGVGETYVALASAPGLAIAERARRWREARSWFQQSLETMIDMRHRGHLLDDDLRRIDEIAREIAKCLAAAQGAVSK